MSDHAVVIAGGVPTGLTKAGELALARIDVVIVEGRASQDLDGSASLTVSVSQDLYGRTHGHHNGKGRDRRG